MLIHSKMCYISTTTRFENNSANCNKCIYDLSLIPAIDLTLRSNFRTGRQFLKKQAQKTIPSLSMSISKRVDQLKKCITFRSQLVL